MVSHKLKGVLGIGDKISNHGSSSSQTVVQRRITNIEIVVQHLQHHLRSYHGEDLRAKYSFPYYGGFMQEYLQ